MTPSQSPLPAETLRLFDGYDAHQLSAVEARDFVIGRLLEEGDSADLVWLGSQVDRAGLRQWMEQRGERQLSRRSRLFWQRVFGLAGLEEVTPAGSEPLRKNREALWPH